MFYKPQSNATILGLGLGLGLSLGLGFGLGLRLSVGPRLLLGKLTRCGIGSRLKRSKASGGREAPGASVADLKPSLLP